LLVDENIRRSHSWDPVRSGALLRLAGVMMLAGAGSPVEEVLWPGACPPLEIWLGARPPLGGGWCLPVPPEWLWSGLCPGQVRLWVIQKDRPWDMMVKAQWRHFHVWPRRLLGVSRAGVAGKAALVPAVLVPPDPCGGLKSGIFGGVELGMVRARTDVFSAGWCWPEDWLPPVSSIVLRCFGAVWGTARCRCYVRRVVGATFGALSVLRTARCRCYARRVVGATHGA
jgi:hypothetical protein